MADAAKQLNHHLRALFDPARHETAGDGELLAHWAADGDGQAFAALVWRHGPLVWRVGRSVLQQTQDAEDVFQATFLVLTRKAGRLKGRESIAGWLSQTAYQLALQTRRGAGSPRRARGPRGTAYRDRSIGRAQRPGSAKHSDRRASPIGRRVSRSLIVVLFRGGHARRGGPAAGLRPEYARASA